MVEEQRTDLGGTPSHQRCLAGMPRWILMIIWINWSWFWWTYIMEVWWSSLRTKSVRKHVSLSCHGSRPDSASPVRYLRSQPFTFIVRTLQSGLLCFLFCLPRHAMFFFKRPWQSKVKAKSPLLPTWPELLMVFRRKENEEKNKKFYVKTRRMNRGNESPVKGDLKSREVLFILSVSLCETSSTLRGSLRWRITYYRHTYDPPTRDTVSSMLTPRFTRFIPLNRTDSLRLKEFSDNLRKSYIDFTYHALIFMILSLWNFMLFYMYWTNIIIYS